MATGLQGWWRRGQGRGAALALACVVAVALYVTLDGGGNGADASACAAAGPAAKALDPLVGGEVAAFQVARTPQKLSELSFIGADGAPMRLAAFAGKVALLNLWATWCAPCRQEMPALDRLQAALGGADFSVVPVSVDTAGKERAAQFLESVEVKNLPLYTDPSTGIFAEVKKRSLALGLPVSILIDRNGCHLGHMNAPAAWDSDDARRLIEAAIGESAVPQG